MGHATMIEQGVGSGMTQRTHCDQHIESEHNGEYQVNIHQHSTGYVDAMQAFEWDIGSKDNFQQLNCAFKDCGKRALLIGIEGQTLTIRTLVLPENGHQRRSEANGCEKKEANETHEVPEHQLQHDDIGAESSVPPQDMHGLSCK